MSSACTIAGCTKPLTARGLCNKHYQRMKKYGDPNRLPPTIVDRFWTKVSKQEASSERRPGLGPCWEWLGCDNGIGYGMFSLRRDGKPAPVLAHRFAYELMVGPIPEGLTIDHLCFNKRCVNPTHLEAVTNAENNRRGNSVTARNARKTHCKNGHEFTPENTYFNKFGRSCRKCHAAWEREYRNRKSIHGRRDNLLAQRERMAASPFTTPAQLAEIDAELAKWEARVQNYEDGARW